MGVEKMDKCLKKRQSALAADWRDYKN